MTTIYLVRHGTVDNPRDILYGRLPRFALSSHGIEQAIRTSRILGNTPVAAIYTSPRLRARQTALVLRGNQPDVPVRVSRLLDEVRTSYQGSNSAALGRDFNFYEPKHDPSDETIEDIYRRMVRLIRRLRRRHEGESVVCVSHGDPIIIARTGLAGLPLVFANLRQDGYPAPASLSILRFQTDAEQPELSYVDPSHERRR